MGRREREFYLVSCSPSHPSLHLIPHQVGISSSRGKANGHISRQLVPPRRLGGCEVIPSLLLPSTLGIHHFITVVGEEGGKAMASIIPPFIYPSFNSSFYLFHCYFYTKPNQLLRKKIDKWW